MNSSEFMVCIFLLLCAITDYYGSVSNKFATQSRWVPTASEIFYELDNQVYDPVGKDGGGQKAEEHQDHRPDCRDCEAHGNDGGNKYQEDDECYDTVHSETPIFLACQCVANIPHKLLFYQLGHYGLGAGGLQAILKCDITHLARC